MASNPTVRVGFLGDASQLAREAERARRSLAGVETQSHTLSTALGTALGYTAGKGIAVVANAARNAAASMVGFAKDSIDAASNLNESISKSEQVFGSSADAVRRWAQDSTRNILLTNQTAIEAASTFGNLFVALGMGQAPAAALSTKLVGLAEDLSSFNNVGVDDALLALRSGMIGEAEPLRKFGVQLSEARVQAEAFALGIAKPVKDASAIRAAQNNVAAAAANLAKVQKEHGVGTLAAAQAQDKLTRANAALSKAMAGQKVNLTDAQKAQARLSIILHDTAKAQGDAQRTSGGYANSTRILHKRIGDLQASIGQKLLPYAERATTYMSNLVEQFDKGTGAGGRLREDLGKLAKEAGGVADSLSPVVGVARWFFEHPTAFKVAADSMVVYAAATKSAAVWSALIKPPPTVGVPGAGGGFSLGSLPGLVGTAGLTGIYEFNKWYHDNASGFGRFGQNNPLSNSLFGGKPKNAVTPLSGDAMSGLRDSRSGLDLPNKSRLTLGVPTGVVATAAKAAQATKAAADTSFKAQQYAADKAQAAADAKAKAADALAAATQKLQDALQTRQDMAKNIRDSLVSSNTVVREGVSWTAKDLLSRFQLQMDKVKRFSAAISAMVHKGFSSEIVQQVAEGGVANLGTALGLSRASAGQVSQFNRVQGSIDKAAGYAGDRVAKQLGPIQITTNLVVSDKVLATAVNRWNARNGYNGARLAS